MVLLFVILLMIFIGLLTYYIFQLRSRYEYFSKRGIATPPFQLFFGHLKTLWKMEKYHRQLQHWTKQYGNIYGIYEGTVPIFVVSDVNFLQEVFVKQFSIFHARKKSLLDSIHSNVFSSSGLIWRRFRHIINPTFTASKMKMMSPLINACIDDLMKKLNDHLETNKEFNIYVYYKRLTMDTICRCAFGIDTDIQNNPNNIYLKRAEELFAENVLKDNSFFRLTQIIPQINKFGGKLFIFDANLRSFINTYILHFITTKQLYMHPFVWFLNKLHAIVEHRQKTPISRIDFLHLLLQVATDQPVHDTIEESKEDYRLTYEEIIHNIYIFMIAGYETTSTALAYATYELAKHPDIVEKLRAEIDQLPLDNDDDGNEKGNKYPDYDIVAQMPYMENFISEVLRMYPIANTIIQRRATEDTVIQGIKIDKGSVVQADIYSVHFDRDLWGPEDPYVFYPERHERKRHRMASLAFGAGPRQCVGIRFALIEMKIALIRLLRDYTILPGEHLETKFNIREHITIVPEAVWVKLVKRNLYTF